MAAREGKNQTDAEPGKAKPFRKTGRQSRTDHYLVPTAYCLLPTAYCLLPTAYCLPLPKEGALAASVDYQTEPIIPIPYTLSAKVSASQRRGTYRVAGRSCRLVLLSALRGKT
jgi:hypothetical protein